MRYLSFIFLFISSIAGAQHFYRFIPNMGQWNDPSAYQANVDGGRLFLTENGFVMKLTDYSELMAAHGKPSDLLSDAVRLRVHTYKMELINSQLPKWKHEEQSTEYYNFMLGNDQTRWKGKIHAYGKVVMHNTYPGIDMVYYTQSHQLKYDFVVHGGADATQIQMRYTGQDALYVDKKGQLVIETSLGKVMEMKPYAYQTVNGHVRIIPCNFKVNENVVSFDFPQGYEEHAKLIIDPTLTFSTSSGSFADNFGMTATYDLNGNLFSGGTVFNNGFPYTTGAFDTTFAGTPAQGITDVIITKYNATGTAQIYSTYIGGLQCETVHSLIVNQQDELFFFGCTSSLDFPISTGAFDNTFNGGTFYSSVANGTTFNNGTDIYVSKLSADGTSLLASTYVGGSANDGINYPNALNYDSLQFNYGDQFRGEVMVDDQGNCYLATCTKSADFPIANGFGTTLNGGQAGVVMKFNPSLSNLEWSTYLNGQNKDAAYSLKVNSDYEVYVTGGTTSPNFPTTTGAYQTTFSGGEVDGFIAHISTNGTALLHSTLVGTNAYDQTFFVELDRFGRAHVVGQTLGHASFSITPGVYSNSNSGQFVLSLDSTLSSLQYSTIFGNGNGVINISPAAFLVDVCGNIYISGWGGGIGGSNQQASALSGMPVTPDAIYPSAPNGFDFYLIVLEKNAQGLLYGSYFGGNVSAEHVDGGTSRFDPNGIVYQSVCAGCGGNDDFPSTPGAWSPINNSSNCNNGVFKFDFEIVPVADFAVSALDGCAPLTITFTNNSINNSDFLWDFGNNDTTSIDLNPTRTFPSAGTYNVYLYIEDTACLLTDTALQVVTVYPELFLSAGTDTLLACQPGNITLSASASGHDGQFIWSSSPQLSDTLNSALTDSAVTVNVPAPQWYYIGVSNPGCSIIDSVYVDFVGSSFSITPDIEICKGESAILTAQGQNPIDPVVSINWEADSVIVSGDGTLSVTVSPSSTQYVYVSMNTSLGCVYSDSVLVTVISLGGPVSASISNDTIQLGDTVSIMAYPQGQTYTWFPPDDILDPSADSTIAVPGTLGWNTYTVTVGSGNCSGTATVRIFVYEVECGPPYVYVPNAFTPDGDSNNDRLFVYAAPDVEVYLAIYDRWGELIFETRDKSVGWDGTFRGRKCDPAVFVYYLEALCPGGEEYFEKGNITLIR